MMGRRKGQGDKAAGRFTILSDRQTESGIVDCGVTEIRTETFKREVE